MSGFKNKLVNEVRPRDDATLKCIDELIDNLRNETLNITTPKIDKEQMHMVWTTEGLVFYTPRKDDATYVHATKEAQLEAKNEKREFGIFQSHKLITWAGGAKAIIDTLFRGLVEDYQAKCNTMRKISGPGRFEKMTLMRMGFTKYTRQVTFILVGLFSYGIMPPIELFQFLLSGVHPNSVFKGRLFCDEDKQWYNDKRTNMKGKPVTEMHDAMLTLVDIKQYHVIKGIREFGSNGTLSIWNGASMCITFGKREDAKNARWHDSICYGKVNIHADYSDLGEVCITPPIINSPTPTIVESGGLTYPDTADVTSDTSVIQTNNGISNGGNSSDDDDVIGEMNLV